MADPLAAIPLSAIRVFEAAARLLSFTRAAEELGMTQAAVSWQVKGLERRLGQALFRRLPREVALTPAGERLARAATDAMSGLRTAVSDIVETGEGVLAITTLQTFATHRPARAAASNTRMAESGMEASGSDIRPAYVYVRRSSLSIHVWRSIFPDEDTATAGDRHGRAASHP